MKNMSDFQLQVQLPKEFDDCMVAVRDLVLAIAAGKVDLSAEIAVAVKLLGEFQALPSEVKGEPFRCLKSAELRISELVQALLGVVEPA